MNDIADHDAYMHEEARRRLREDLRDLLRAWEVTFEYHPHPDSYYDFYLPAAPGGSRTRIGFYVVLEVSPGLRQDDVAGLLRQGNQVIVLNREDVLELGGAPGPASAQGIAGRWMRDGDTHGSQARQAAGYHGMLAP